MSGLVPSRGAEPTSKRVPDPNVMALAPVTVLSVSQSAEGTRSLARALDAQKSARVRVVALEQHVPSLSLAQVAGHPAVERALEVPYGCSHSLGAELLGRVRVPANEADLVVLLVGGEANPSEVLSHLITQGVPASLGSSSGATAAVSSHEPHLHLTNIDIILFDGITLEALSEKLKQLKRRVSALHSYEGVFSERSFAMGPDGEVRPGETTPMRSPYGEKANFIRLFGKGILHPALFVDVGIPGLPHGSALNFSARYPIPAEELKVRGLLRPVVWEVDRWFLALGALCEGLGPEQAQQLKSRTVSGQPGSGQSALTRLSADWGSVLAGYTQYRLAVLEVLDSKALHSSGNPKAPEWGLTCVSQLADVQRRFSRFLVRAPELGARVEAVRLGARFVKYARELTGKPPAVAPEVLDVLMKAAESEGVSANERVEAKARFSSIS